MDSHTNELHFILFPLLAQGHMIPMIDIARILAQYGATVTIFTTPVNALRFKPSISRAKQVDKLKIRVVELELPLTEAGLPEGCENYDLLPSADLALNLFNAMAMLQRTVEETMRGLDPKPSCVISDMCYDWTMDVARKFEIPRLVFHGPGCFFLLSTSNLLASRVMDGISSESEKFLIPGLPDRVEITKAKVCGMVDAGSEKLNVLYDKIREAEKASYGIILNSFEELEPEYVKAYRIAKEGVKVWCIGPVSLSNKNNSYIIERGNTASIDEHYCLEWLDSRDPSSVIYVCLGSLSRSPAKQMIELGLGLLLSKRPFVWCIRDTPEEFETWFSSYGFEERVKERGLIIHGWAPQVLILSHQAIGGFLTHCGWNSTLEGICAGLPMITWPHFGDQFFNENFVVEVVKIGVRIGVEVPVYIGHEEEIGVLVTKEDIVTAIDILMNGGFEGGERRKRAKRLGNMARKAMEEGGSSHLNMTMVIQDIIEQLTVTKLKI